MIEIDGSYGEGGGQILRTALALSMCTGKPFRIAGIRASRKKPGLMRQHLTAVRAAETICQATVRGAGIASSTLEFTPGAVVPGAYHFAVGTAGSAMLVLQTILPPLLLASGPSTIRLEGGTHNPLSPPFHFVQQAFLPVLHSMGASCSAELMRWGFFPAGGGDFRVSVIPSPSGLKPIDLTERGPLRQAEVFAAVSQVPYEVARDECRFVSNGARFPVSQQRAEEVPSSGPGNVALLTMTFAGIQTVFSGFGQLGVSRKAVARSILEPANRFYQSAAVVDEHLADQLLLPFALAGGGSFTTVEPTPHTTTNIHVIQSFLDVKIAVKPMAKGLWQIICRKGDSEHGMDQR